MKKCVLAVALALSVVAKPVAVEAVPVVEYPYPEVKFTADDRCLASAVFYEARGEALAVKRAVFDVVQHRMKATGKSACAVVKQKAQFSWYPEYPIKPLTSDLKEMLTEVKQTDKVLINEKFKFFHSGPKPYWAKAMLCKKLGNLNFCKEKK